MKKRILRMLFTLCIAFGLFPAVALAGTYTVEELKVQGTIPAKLAYTTQKEWDALQLTNIERAKTGLPLLVTFDQMQMMGDARSVEQMVLYGHTRPNGLDFSSVFDENGFYYTEGAENIVMGQVTARDFVYECMNSDELRSNILSEELRYMGTGFTYDDKNMNWMQLFANSADSQCMKLDFNPSARYFTLTLKNGITAYAPYDRASVIINNGKMTINYPGVDTYFDIPADTTNPPAQPGKEEVLVKVYDYPKKTNYRKGEGFDTTGLNVVSVIDGREISANDKITFYISKKNGVQLTQGRKFTTTGKKVVELRYEGKKVATYTINVTDLKEGVNILAYPTKTAYKVGEGFDTTGLNAVYYSKGKSTDINKKITFYVSKINGVQLTQGRKFTTTGKKVVELRYNGKKVATYTINVAEAMTDGVKIQAYPTKTVYKFAEGFDISGLKAVYRVNGVETNINDKITFYTSNTVELTSGRLFTTSGKKEVELRYEGKKVGKYTINVASASKNDIKVLSYPTKTTYKVGEGFDSKGLNVVYSANGVEMNVTDRIKLYIKKINGVQLTQGRKFQTTGTKVVEIRYEGKAVGTYTITVTK